MVQKIIIRNPVRAFLHHLLQLCANKVSLYGHQPSTTTNSPLGQAFSKATLNMKKIVEDLQFD